MRKMLYAILRPNVLALSLVLLFAQQPDSLAQTFRCPTGFELVQNAPRLHNGSVLAPSPTSVPATRVKLSAEHPNAAYAIVPTDATSYKNVFGSNNLFSVAKASEMDKSKRTMEAGLPGITIVEKPNQGPLHLRDYIESSPDPVVTIVGHVGEDGKLVFPNGSATHITDIARFSYQNGKLPVFISCYARNHLDEVSPGLSSDVTFAEASRIAMRLDEYLKARSQTGTEVDIERFVNDVNSFLDTAEGGPGDGKVYNVVATTIGGGVVVGIIVAVILSLDDDDD